MSTKYYGGFSGNLGGASIQLTDNSRQVLEALENAKEAVLNKIGAAGRDNARRIAKEKGVYDTGELYRDIDYQPRVSDSAVDIGNRRIGYAVFNELGTRKMPARPYITPSVLENVAEYKKIAEDAIAEKLS